MNSQKSVLRLASHFRETMTETEARRALALAKQVLWRREPLNTSLSDWESSVNRSSGHCSLNTGTHKWDGDVDPLLRVLDAVAQSQWVGVESGVSVGKTFLGACLVFWFLECWRNSTVVTIAPKKDQLALHLWREMNLMWPHFALGQMMTTELRLDPRPKVWEATQFVAGVKAEEVQTSATKAQGFHNENMLIICEETPGIHEAVMTAFENTSTAPHNVIVAFGNPDNQADTLHQFCKRKRVVPIRISGFDHPNVVLKNPDFIPGAQTALGLETLLDKYNRNQKNPLYVSRAQGLSPTQSKNSLIRWEWCEAAARRKPEQAMSGPPALGVDVANSEAGDEAAVAQGVGGLLEQVESFPCRNASLLGSEVVYARMTKVDIEGRNIGVDGVGVGASTVNKLIEMEVDVVDIQSGAGQVEIPDRRMVEQFNNLRSQGWWLLMLDLQDRKGGIVLPYDKELFVDLTTPTWETRSGKICVESKESIKKRLGRSPNKGDAVMYWNLVRRGWLEPRTSGALQFMSL